MASDRGLSPTHTEKPHHYTYLKEFRTRQCQLFLQHKCSQHRPYTCFNWHFMNQKRRRPVRRRDGTFNYSPDTYCTKYEETTGTCPDGDDCPFLHRTAGDTERRYHLRYYKTSACVHDTDSKGHCTKNGQHCAFAHGASDLRQPVCDVKELQACIVQPADASVSDTPLGSTVEKDRINEDPKWNDTNYVLANYKTEPCRRPPRLCRQGYACPQYHNNRDKRRSPRLYKYRSTPCPNVKHADDWGDTTQCEHGDSCSYCHTRTEQQFHPEIYKSTKCNDMVQTGYCPRGPFCAFAHVEQEMTGQRELCGAGETSLAAFVTNALPDGKKSLDSPNSANAGGISNGFGGLALSADPRGRSNSTSGAMASLFSNSLLNQCGDGMSVAETIAKTRTHSLSAASAAEYTSSFYHSRAPGSEREDAQAKLKSLLDGSHPPSSNLTSGSLDQFQQQRQSLMNSLASATQQQQQASIVAGFVVSNLGSTPTTPMSSLMSPHASSFYPAGDTVESVIGNALEEDLDIGELNLSLSRDMAKEEGEENNMLCNSIGSGLTGYLGLATSVPVTIPGPSGYTRTRLSSLQHSPPNSSPSALLASSFGASSFLQQQQKQDNFNEMSFMNNSSAGKYPSSAMPCFSSSHGASGMAQPQQQTQTQPIHLDPSLFYSNDFGGADVQQLRGELTAMKYKLGQYEEALGRAKNACDLWKKEVEDVTRKARDEKAVLTKQRDDAISELTRVKWEMEVMRGGGRRTSEFEILQAYQQKQQQPVACLLCFEKKRLVVTKPCGHAVTCETCSYKTADCPLCHSKIVERGMVASLAPPQQPAITTAVTTNHMAM